MAKTTWGRKETIIWPQHRPIYTYGAIFAAMFLTAVFLYGRLRFIGTPLQRFYMPVYVRTSVFGIVQPDAPQPVPDALSDRARREAEPRHE